MEAEKVKKNIMLQMNGKLTPCYNCQIFLIALGYVTFKTGNGFVHDHILSV